MDDGILSGGCPFLWHNESQTSFWRSSGDGIASNSCLRGVLLLGMDDGILSGGCLFLWHNGYQTSFWRSSGDGILLH